MHFSSSRFFTRKGNQGKRRTNDARQKNPTVTVAVMNAGEARHETAFLTTVMFAKFLVPKKKKPKKKFQILMLWRGIGEGEVGMV